MAECEEPIVGPRRSWSKGGVKSVRLGRDAVPPCGHPILGWVIRMHDEDR